MFPIFNTNYILALSLFLISGIAAGVLATAMTKSAVCLKNKSRIPDGVIGGILLGIITSIPELISGVMGVVSYASNPNPDYTCGVLGDAIGSDMFCIFALAFALLICVSVFKNREAKQINTFTVSFIVVGAIFCLLAGLFENNGLIYGEGGLIPGPSPIVWHGFNLFSIFIFLSYAASVTFMIFGSRVWSKSNVMRTILPTRKKQKGLWFGHLSLGQLITVFVCFAAGLTIFSLVLASTAEALIVTHWGMDAGFGRSLLLGVATSLPELISIISLAKSKEYNIAIDTTAGSCGFNLIILFICNIAYSIALDPNTITTHTMYKFDDVYNALQLILFLFELIFLIAYLVVNSRGIKQYLTKKQVIGINSTCLALILITYFSFIAVGFLINSHTNPSLIIPAI